MGVEQQAKDVKLQTNNANHQVENVKLGEPKPKPKQERDNELETIFHNEPIEEQRRKPPMLAKYVRRHHKPKQIIGDVESSVLTRKKLRNETCLLCEFEPKLVKDALDNEDWI